MTPYILLVGCGRMGSAMLQGWAENYKDACIYVMDPHLKHVKQFIKYKNVIFIEPNHKPPQGIDINIIILAIKPQLIAEVLPSITGWVGAQTVVLSIAAGRTLNFLSKHFPQNTPLIRAMPNLPASVGSGITAVVTNDHVNFSHRDLAHRLLAAIGDVIWISDEKLLDAVTAISGSGPAYVLYLTESLIIAGMKAGLPHHLAESLARSTVCGTGDLIRRAPESLAKMRENVTSPGGTTEAALKILMAENGMEKLLVDAAAAAAARSRELAE